MGRDKNKYISKRPSLFSNTPGNTADPSESREVLLKLLSDTNFSSTASFRYDTPGSV